MILLTRKKYISYYNPCNFSLLEIELHLTVFNVIEVVLLLQEIGITASADNTVRVWSIPNSSCAYVIKVSIDQLMFTCSKSTIGTCEICSKLTVNAPEQRHDKLFSSSRF